MKVAGPSGSGGDGKATGDGGFVRSKGDAGWVNSGSTGASVGGAGFWSVTAPGWYPADAPTHLLNTLTPAAAAAITHPARSTARGRKTTGHAPNAAFRLLAARRRHSAPRRHLDGERPRGRDQLHEGQARPWPEAAPVEPPLLSRWRDRADVEGLRRLLGLPMGRRIQHRWVHERPGADLRPGLLRQRGRQRMGQLHDAVLPGGSLGH